VPPNALACPECGADHKSGWREDAAIYDGLDLPGEEDDLTMEPQQISRFWIVAAVVLIAALAVFLLLR
jgi:hypothetical protein